MTVILLYLLLLISTISKKIVSALDECFFNRFVIKKKCSINMLIVNKLLLKYI